MSAPRLGLASLLLSMEAGATSAADLNLAGMNAYSQEEQVTSISQFAVVRPTGTYQRCCPLKVASLSTFAQLTAFCFSWATS